MKQLKQTKNLILLLAFMNAIPALSLTSETNQKGFENPVSAPLEEVCACQRECIVHANNYTFIRTANEFKSECGRSIGYGPVLTSCRPGTCWN